MGAWTPPPKLKVSDWADTNRRLDAQSSAEPGQWYTSRAEYQRGMMDACSDPAIQEVVIMSGAQLGKSEAILNIIGYFIDNDPCPILVMQPTVDMAQAFSKDRVAAGLLRSTPSLQFKVRDPRSRDSGNTTLHKVFPGGALTLVGANSPAGLASRPIRVVLCDEVDRYPPSAGSEGDPIQLARKRTATYWNRKVIMVSTPTNKGASRIEQAFERSDKRFYYVPCQHCQHKQTLKWANVKWDKDKPETAHYVCENCGCTWSDSDRMKSIRYGEWVKTAESEIAGFYINAMYSPWTPLADGVREFLSVRKNPEQLRVWTNTYLGETWEDGGETIDDLSLAERAEAMEKVPAEVMFITAGADTQNDRLEVSLVGWGRDDESWVLAHHILYGDPSTPQLWANLDSLLFQTFESEDGREMTIRSTCIDSGGHFTNQVYNYCKKHYAKRVFAIKGVGGEGKPIAGRPSKSNIAKCPLFPVGVDTVKDLLFARMRIQEPGAGYIHFSDALSEEYYKQLTAEKVVLRYHKGFAHREFVKIRRRNEALDCMVYSVAAYSIIGINVNSLADKMERQEPKVEPEPARKRQPFVPKTGRGFVNSWR